ncbi:type-F conjugative transfer system protein TraW [Noviherbaspirillum sedimenti]|uniref:Type-F conjugative transfer system protein TraW n=1 Tax=Noviherbaspirillum sedimenti TaxID=2320865 RepID=A0A3A3FY66_9BURK|nr:type-F conjugative transfer system protein TraW [Noviherbaspirillum sedimenti]RJG00561.1 type-F conjugative transfer system protein TraW [Noviherbaspirillum sedimenti]
MLRRLVPMLSATALAVCAAAQAGDLGTIGPAYPVAEPHLLDFIRARLQEKERNGELQKLAKDAQTRGTAAVTTPTPVAGVTLAQTTRTFYVDPTFVLDRNILDDKGRLLFAAGTRKNPLEIVSLSKHLLFFDGRDRRQVARARDLITFYRARKIPVKPILVGGSYLDLMKAWRAPVYYDQQGLLTRRLGIGHVPALVTQEGLRLRIDELVLP